MRRRLCCAHHRAANIVHTLLVVQDCRAVVAIQLTRVCVRRRVVLVMSTSMWLSCLKVFIVRCCVAVVRRAVFVLLRPSRDGRCAVLAARHSSCEACPRAAVALQSMSCCLRCNCKVFIVRCSPRGSRSMAFIVLCVQLGACCQCSTCGHCRCGLCRLALVMPQLAVFFVVQYSSCGVFVRCPALCGIRCPALPSQ